MSFQKLTNYFRYLVKRVVLEINDNDFVKLNTIERIYILFPQIDIDLKRRSKKIKKRIS